MSSSNLFSGEIQFLWSKSLGSGSIYDMEFMPDNDFFIMSTNSGVQIRRTETGELINALPFFAANLEFTPDSTKLITTNGNDKLIQMRNMIDYNLIKEYTIPNGIDTTDLIYEVSSIVFKQIVVDPVRPILYALRERRGYISGGKYVNITRIMIYNYETMQEVGELTLSGDINRHIKYIAISKDGKYLASINEGESHIMVWDLNTRQKIRNSKLCEGNPNATWGNPDQIQFSENNTENIYFSGIFPQTAGNEVYQGIFIYNLGNNNIIDSTFGVGTKRVGYGPFGIFDNEMRALKTAGTKILILNLQTHLWEQQINKDTITGGKIFWGYNKYSPINRYFIGGGKNNFSCMRNNLGTDVIPLHEEKIIYPNPTTSIISVDRNCEVLLQSYTINDISGQLPFQETNIPPGNDPITINFSQYPTGIYFIRYKCGSKVSVYKVIKQG
jgi:WD40 repeat protein